MKLTTRKTHTPQRAFLSAPAVLATLSFLALLASLTLLVGGCGGGKSGSDKQAGSETRKYGTISFDIAWPKDISRDIPANTGIIVATLTNNAGQLVATDYALKNTPKIQFDAQADSTGLGASQGFVIGSYKLRVEAFAATNPLTEQKIEITGNPTGGSFALKYKGNPTPDLPYNATSVQIKTALNVIAPGVDCAGGPLPGAPVIITLAGATNGIVADGAKLTGGTPSVNVSLNNAGVSLAAGEVPSLNLNEGVNTLTVTLREDLNNVIVTGTDLAQGTTVSDAQKITSQILAIDAAVDALAPGSKTVYVKTLDSAGKVTGTPGQFDVSVDGQNFAMSASSANFDVQQAPADTPASNKFIITPKRSTFTNGADATIHPQITFRYKTGSGLLTVVLPVSVLPRLTPVSSVTTGFVNGLYINDRVNQDSAEKLKQSGTGAREAATATLKVRLKGANNTTDPNDVLVTVLKGATPVTGLVTPEAGSPTRVGMTDEYEFTFTFTAPTGNAKAGVYTVNFEPKDTSGATLPTGVSVPIVSIPLTVATAKINSFPAPTGDLKADGIATLTTTIEGIKTNLVHYTVVKNTKNVENDVLSQNNALTAAFTPLKTNQVADVLPYTSAIDKYDVTAQINGTDVTANIKIGVKELKVDFTTFFDKVTAFDGKTFEAQVGNVAKANAEVTFTLTPDDSPSLLATRTPSDKADNNLKSRVTFNAPNRPGVFQLKAKSDFDPGVSKTITITVPSGTINGVIK